MGMVLRQGMTLVAIGSAIGLLLGAGAGQVLSGARFGTPRPDALMFAGAAALFALSASRRATCRLAGRRGLARWRRFGTSDRVGRLKPPLYGRERVERTLQRARTPTVSMRKSGTGCSRRPPADRDALRSRDSSGRTSPPAHARARVSSS